MWMILHEMGHIAGLRHEFARADQGEHLVEEKEATEGAKSRGAFDYYSLMQYPFACKSDPESSWGNLIKDEKREYQRCAAPSPTKTFSAGDLSALK